MTNEMPDQAVQEPIAAERSRAVNVDDDDRQRTRGEQRTEHALQRPAGDEDLDGLRQRAHQRDHTEATDADQEDPARTEHVAQRAADEDQRSECQQVGVGHPLLAGEPSAEIALDRGESDVHDRRVQSCHERAHDRRDQDQALVIEVQTTQAGDAIASPREV